MDKIQSNSTCNKCGASLRESSKFCDSCGEQVKTEYQNGNTENILNENLKKVCKGCFKANDATSKYCYSCGIELPKNATEPTLGDPAGFWIRVLAVIIDIVVLTGIEYLIENGLGINSDFDESLSFNELLIAMRPLLIVSTIISGTYSTIMVGTWGGTVGKIVLKMKITRLDGHKLTYGLSLMRWFSSYISYGALCIGCIWVVFSPLKRSWHDYLCDTRVSFKSSRT